MNQETADKIKKIFLDHGVRSKHNIINEMEENNQDPSACLAEITLKVTDYDVQIQDSDVDTLWQIYDDVDTFEDDLRRRKHHEDFIIN